MKKKSEYIIAIILIVLPIILGIIILIIGGKEFYEYKMNKELSSQQDKIIENKLNEDEKIQNEGTAISTFEKGDIIEFSEKEWVIINKTKTAVGVILKNYLPDREFCSNMEKRYSLTDYESLLYYLNEDFIESLDKEKIIDYNWEIGPYGNQDANVIKAKVGLLTRKEFMDLKMSGISENFRVTDGNAWWLLTTSQGDLLDDAMSVVTADNKLGEGWIKGSYVVKPVIYILNNTSVGGQYNN